MNPVRALDKRAESDADPPVISNTVAVIGIVLACVAAVMVGLLFLLVEQQPDEIGSFEDKLGADTPAQFRLVILGCTAAVLAVVSLILCTVGLFLPNRPRILATVGAAISLVLLLGVFGVVLVGALINPAAQPAGSVDENPAGRADDRASD